MGRGYFCGVQSLRWAHFAEGVVLKVVETGYAGVLVCWICLLRECKNS